MNRVLQDIIETGQVLLPSDDRVPVLSQIDPTCGALVQSAISEVRPKTAVEVGLAFGISTLHMLEALSAAGSQKLIGMDPAQHDNTWRGGGLHNVERAEMRGGIESLRNVYFLALRKRVDDGRRWYPSCISDVLAAQ